MLDAIAKRRSIRRFEDRGVEPELLERLEEAVLRSPTSRNLRPWRFVFVTDQAVLGRLSRRRSRSRQWLADAPLGVVVCGDETVSDCWIEDCSIASASLLLAATDLGLGSCWIQIRGRFAADGRPARGARPGDPGPWRRRHPQSCASWQSVIPPRRSRRTSVTACPGTRSRSGRSRPHEAPGGSKVEGPPRMS